MIQKGILSQPHHSASVSQADYRKEMYAVTIQWMILIPCLWGKYCELFITEASSERGKKEDRLFFTTFHLYIFKGGNVVFEFFQYLCSQAHSYDYACIFSETQFTI